MLNLTCPYCLTPYGKLPARCSICDTPLDRPQAARVTLGQVSRAGEITEGLPQPYVAQIESNIPPLAVLRLRCRFQKLDNPSSLTPVSARLLAIDFKAWPNAAEYLQASPDDVREKFTENLKYNIDRLGENQQHLLALIIPILVENRTQVFSAAARRLLFGALAESWGPAGAKPVQPETDGSPEAANAELVVTAHPGRRLFVYVSYPQETLEAWGSWLEMATVAILPQVIIATQTVFSTETYSFTQAAVQKMLAAWVADPARLGQAGDWEWALDLTQSYQDSDHAPPDSRPAPPAPVSTADLREHSQQRPDTPTDDTRGSRRRFGARTLRLPMGLGEISERPSPAVWVYAALAIGLVCSVIALCSFLVSFLPSLSATPTSRPVAIQTKVAKSSTPTALPSPIATATPACLPASEVTLDQVDQTICISGVIASVRNDSVARYVSFRGADFQLITYNLSLKLGRNAGECVQVNGKVDRLGNRPILIFTQIQTLTDCGATLSVLISATVMETPTPSGTASPR